MRGRYAGSLLLAIISVCATCISAHAFTTTWTDQFGETTYEISGPDSAVAGDSLLIVLRATDPVYPDSWVAASWSFTVDGVEHDGGFSIWTSGGTWVSTYPFLYPEPGSHTYTFRAQDLGHGGGHNYAWFEISGATQILPPAGACCFVDCHCVMLDPAVCVEQGGYPLGPDVTCDPNPCSCPPPIGACCIGDQGDCALYTQEECWMQGGIYQGDGTFCDPNPCLPVPARSTTWGRIRAEYR